MQELHRFNRRPGVAFDGSNADHAKRYKLFNEPELRRVVFNRLALQVTQIGACRENPTIRMALACGRIRNDADRAASCAVNFPEC